MRRLVPPALLTVLVLPALTLAGCGGSSGDDPSPSPTVSTTTSASPTAPALPEAAMANTKAGAVAFARHYIELINYAQATGTRVHCGRSRLLAASLVTTQTSTCRSFTPTADGSVAVGGSRQTSGNP